MKHEQEIKKYGVEDAGKMDKITLSNVGYVRSRLKFASTIWNPAASVCKDDIKSIKK